MDKNKKLTKEQLDWIKRNMTNEDVAPLMEGFVPASNLQEPQQPTQYQIPLTLGKEAFEKKQEALMKMKELQEGFDMKELQDMFNEGVKCGAIPNTINQYLINEFNGWIYVLKRSRKQ